LAYSKTHGNIKLPVSEDLHDRSIILPLYVPMKEQEIQKVIDVFLKLIR